MGCKKLMAVVWATGPTGAFLRPVGVLSLLITVDDTNPALPIIGNIP